MLQDLQGGVYTAKRRCLFSSEEASLVLEHEGFVERESTRSHSQKAPRLKWRKKKAGRRPKNDRPSPEHLFHPATA
jgi:hypothetical protein